MWCRLLAVAQGAATAQGALTGCMVQGMALACGTGHVGVWHVAAWGVGTWPQGMAQGVAMA